MERKSYWLIVFFSVFLPNLIASNYSDRIYQAFVEGDIVLWKKTMLELEQISPKTRAMWEELVSFQYGYTGYCIGIGNHREAEIYIAKLDKNLKNPQILQQGLRESYRSAWYAFKIGVNRLSAPFLGPKSIEYAEKAIKEYPNCYMGYVQRANFYLYAPSIFGGDKSKAVVYFSKALNIMDQHPPIRNWNYLNLMTLNARAMYESGDTKGAIQILQRVLKMEPKFSWVSKEILPAYLKGEKPNYIRNLEKYGYNE